MSAHAKEQGFTLMEIVIAMAIFALVSLASYQLLSAMTLMRDKASRKSVQLAELQSLLVLLHQDFAQAAPCPPDLKEPQPPQSEEGMGEPLYAFCRRGWDGAAEAARGRIEYIRYARRGGALLRQHYPAVGGEDVLRVASGVEAVSIAFMDPAGAWQKSWDDMPAQNAALPRAVAVKLEITGIGKVEQWIALAR